jgi:HAE1 family hydrophobic/amphiphilic exporter-1
MKALIELSVRQPITVAVGVILLILAGVIAAVSVSVRMTPTIDSVVISVTTNWEGASPEQIESDIIELQERRLGNVSNLLGMTSLSRAGSGQIRLEFRTGADINQAMAEVDQKINEVPGYPEAVSQPVIEAIDPDSVDYIAWVGLATSDPSFDATTLYDFMERRLKPRFERIPGISQVGIVGAREREVRIQVDPLALAQRGLTYAQLEDALRLSNDNYSGGLLPDGKNDISIRSIGRFYDVERLRNLIVRRDESGPVYLYEIADVVESHKELTGWVRARGHRMPFFNFQLEHGANLLDTVEDLKAEIARLNDEGGVLAQHARQLGLKGGLELVMTYDASAYVYDALRLVRGTILIGGSLASARLLLFLRSARTIGIIALAVPISVVGSVILLVALGRSINIISLAGMAFAVGMVVDNAIVVIENIFRHLEMGKDVRQASLDGTKEVAGAVLASTLTTLIVFFPILLIQESAGQLFRDIALAIMAAVGLSLIVAVTVIPSSAARLLKGRSPEAGDASFSGSPRPRVSSSRRFVLHRLWQGLRRLTQLPDMVESLVRAIIARPKARWLVIAGFALLTLAGTALLIPPLDYLPRGNRNIIFGLMIPPPGYNVDQMFTIGQRVEAVVRPAWEAAGEKFQAEKDVRAAEGPAPDRRVPVVGFPGTPPVMPPPLDHYFLVSWTNRIFQVGIVQDKKRVADAIPLFNAAASAANAPDVLSFAFQLPLFRIGGTSGSAIKIDLVGDDLDRVGGGGAALFLDLIKEFGPAAVTPEPANFLLPAPELAFTPNDERLRELGMTRRDVGLAVQANSDGILLVRQFDFGGELKDLKIISPTATGDEPVESLLSIPLAAPDGSMIDLQSVAQADHVRTPNQIKRVDRQRAVTLQFTPPPGLPLEQAVGAVEQKIQALRAVGAVSPDVEVKLAGSAGNLAQIREALLGDGSLPGLITSSLFLAVLVVYLLMVVLFQNWKYPAVIMITVPLAVFGGFIGLAIVHHLSVADPYLPVQNMDVLTIMGFVILTGTVVNSAILIVHQTLNLLREPDGALPPTPDKAIVQATRSRVRPIMMSTLTSVLGMFPLVVLPGSGSELYRGLGAVVVGGMLVSTVFTLILVPALLSTVFALERRPLSADAPVAAPEPDLTPVSS